MNIIKQHQSSPRIVENGLMVLKQLLCNKYELHQLIDTQCNLQELLSFFADIILNNQTATILSQELSLLCIIQLKTRGQALATMVFPPVPLTNLFPEED